MTTDFAKKIVLWTIAIAMLMEGLDATIVSTAIPQMALSLNTSVISLKVALTSYLLSLAVFIPISGWLADKFGPKRVFLFAIIFFTLSSILCGISTNIVELIIARVMQGLGASLMTPVGRLVILKLYPRADLVKTTNYVIVPALIGPMLGPVLGGVITTFSAWRWVFFVNIPFGLLGIVLSLIYMKNYKAENKIAFDATGFVLLSLGFVGLSFGFNLISEEITSTYVIVMLLMLSIISLLFYFWYYTITKHPVFDLKVFRTRTFRVSVLGGLLARLGLGSTSFLLPLIFQIGLGLSPLYSGLLILPQVAAAAPMKLFVGRLLRFYGFKKILTISPLLIGLSVASFALITPHSSYGLIILLVGINGLIGSVQYSCINVLTYSDLPDADVSKGTSIASVMMQLSMGFSIAISAIVITYFVGSTHALEIGNLAPLHNACLILGAITVTSSIAFLGLKNTDGQHVSHHKLIKR